MTRIYLGIILGDAVYRPFKVSRPTKSPPFDRAGFFNHRGKRLLQLDFLVHHMLTSDGVKFHDLHLLGHVLFVLGRRVKVASSSGRFQFDFFTHDRSPCAARKRRALS